MKKKPQEVDQLILLALAQGELGKDIAKRFGVSAGYVSKLKTGKKIPSLKIAEPTLIKDEFFEVDSVDLTDLLIELNNKKVIMQHKDITEYIEVQMKKCLIHAKMYQIILNNLKGE